MFWLSGLKNLLFSGFALANPVLPAALVQIRDVSLPNPLELFSGLSLGTFLLSLLILGLALFATRLSKAISQYAGQRRTAGRGVVKLLPLLNLAIWITAAGLVIGLNLSGSSGWVSVVVLIAIVAVTLASHRLLQDLVGGVVLILERPFQIGDRLKIRDLEGQVRYIGLRSFQLVGSDLSVSSIPNSEILKNSVTNRSRGGLESQVIIDLTVPENCDLSEARRIAREAVVLCPYTYLNRPVEVFLGPDEADSPGPVLRVQAHVFDARYAHQLKTHVISLTHEGWKSLVEKQAPSS